VTTVVQISPLPAWARKTKFRPLPPPIFPDGDPAPEDRELALALFAELDPESQQWYGSAVFIERMSNSAPAEAPIRRANQTGDRSGLALRPHKRGSTA
jgi:hypothetical protein